MINNRFSNKTKQQKLFDKINKIYKMRTIFTCGFYISMFLWMITIFFTMLFELSAQNKIIMIVITLLLYIFFVVAKTVVEYKIKKKWKSYFFLQNNIGYKNKNSILKQYIMYYEKRCYFLVYLLCISVVSLSCIFVEFHWR